MTWETKLLTWTKPSSDTEEAKHDRTEQQVRDALAAHPRLSKQPLKVYAKGSYANHTNVRLDSDVDINVEYTDGFYYDGVGDKQGQVSKTVAGITDYSGPHGSFKDYKSEVEEALRTAFGADVQRTNKCMTIRGRTTTLPADVVPCWEFHSYYPVASGARFVQGTALFTDSGSRRIDNYPQQHHENGVEKNNQTNTRFKKTVRILKRLENEMVDAGKISDVPSYLIECLAYRCSNSDFEFDSYTEIVREVLATIYNSTKGAEPVGDSERWLEVNNIKFLFHSTQQWTRDQANGFALAAWQHLGLN